MLFSALASVALFATSADAFDRRPSKAKVALVNAGFGKELEGWTVAEQLDRLNPENGDVVAARNSVIIPEIKDGPPTVETDGPEGKAMFLGPPVDNDNPSQVSVTQFSDDAFGQRCSAENMDLRDTENGCGDLNALVLSAWVQVQGDSGENAMKPESKGTITVSWRERQVKTDERQGGRRSRRVLLGDNQRYEYSQGVSVTDVPYTTTENKWMRIETAVTFTPRMSFAAANPIAMSIGFNRREGDTSVFIADELSFDWALGEDFQNAPLAQPEPDLKRFPSGKYRGWMNSKGDKQTLSAGKEVSPATAIAVQPVVIALGALLALRGL